MTMEKSDSNDKDEEISKNGETEETEEKEEIESTEETIEEIDRDEIIGNYIDHIRNMADLSDDEMESVLNDVIEEDEELLDILGGLTPKLEDIGDKIIVILSEKDDENKTNKEEMRKEIDDVLETFDDDDYAYPLDEVIGTLKDSGYDDPGTVITDVINEGVLCVDSIDEDETVYLALTKEGESLWKLRNSL